MQVDNRTKLPGYTGHIPYKQDLIGVTTGEANRLSSNTYDMANN